MAAASARAVAVAYSGGRDSTALLHATACAARAQGGTVHALHVHHGLSRMADDWLRHGEHQCAAWAAAGLPVQFHAERVAVMRRGGQSLEAQAREARYAALARMAHAAGCSTVLLAHHRRDQAETFLLQALRGAGLAGLAAMPRERVHDGITWCRPWLDQPAEAVAAYVAQHRLSHIDDDSNADPRHARNRLRIAVWPALQGAFPGCDDALATSARWAHEARQALDELAALDAPAVVGPDGALALEALAALGPVRGRNLLRGWLMGHLNAPPSAAEFERLWAELAGRAPARWPLGGSADAAPGAGPAGEVRRYRGRLSWWPAAGVTPPLAFPSRAEPTAPPASVRVALRRAGRYRIDAWGGWLLVRRVAAQGLPLAALARLELRPRTGGEQFQRAPGTPPRSLKKQFQAAGRAHWERGGPLGYVDGALVWVPGLGIDARAWAAEGQPQAALDWDGAGASPGPASPN